VVQRRGVDRARSRSFALWVASVLAVGLVGCGTSPLSPTERLDAADVALVQGRYEVARAGYSDVLATDPDNSRALLGSARSHPAPEDVDLALQFYSRYRESGGNWTPSIQGDYCAALVISTERALLQPDPLKAVELSSSLTHEACRNRLVAELELRSALSLADEERRAGRSQQALELYLSLLPTRTGYGAEAVEPGSEPFRGDFDPGTLEDSRARAYMGAAELLLESNRRDEALTLLEDALVLLPANRDLIRLMVAILAERNGHDVESASPPHSIPGALDSRP